MRACPGGRQVGGGGQGVAGLPPSLAGVGGTRTRVRCSGPLGASQGTHSPRGHGVCSLHAGDCVGAGCVAREGRESKVMGRVGGWAASKRARARARGARRQVGGCAPSRAPRTAAGPTTCPLTPRKQRPHILSNQAGWVGRPGPRRRGSPTLVLSPPACAFFFGGSARELPPPARSPAPAHGSVPRPDDGPAPPRRGSCSGDSVWRRVGEAHPGGRAGVARPAIRALPPQQAGPRIAFLQLTGHAPSLPTQGGGCPPGHPPPRRLPPPVWAQGRRGW